MKSLEYVREHSPAIAIVENVDVPVAHLVITAALLSLPGYTLVTCGSEALDSGDMSRRRRWWLVTRDG